jgi:hypothetical protein
LFGPFEQVFGSAHVAFALGQRVDSVPIIAGL